MLRQPLDTTKEVKFYTSWVFPAGALVFSVIFGFGSALFLSTYNYYNLGLDLVIGVLFLLVCLVVFTGSIYTMFNPLLLTINKEGMSAPSIGNIQWSSIIGIYIGNSNPEYPYPTSLNISLLNGTSHNLSTLAFSISPYDLLEILKTYHKSA
ncbi:MAG: hypothetical protein WCT41_02870 [Candidatus Paceibacterota bacterium]|jgi:hypothetical protein